MNGLNFVIHIILLLVAAFYIYEGEPQHAIMMLLLAISMQIDSIIERISK